MRVRIYPLDTGGGPVGTFFDIEADAVTEFGTAPAGNARRVLHYNPSTAFAMLTIDDAVPAPPVTPPSGSPATPAPITGATPTP